MSRSRNLLPLWIFGFVSCELWFFGGVWVLGFACGVGMGLQKNWQLGLEVVMGCD
jgi:hypothetical protein